MKQTLLIVPREIEDHTKPQPTQGTRVMFEDGSEVAGVERITLVAEINELWKATITTHFVHLPPEGLRAESEIIPSQILQDSMDKIEADFPLVLVRVNLDGSVKLDGTFTLEDLEEVCRRIRGLTK